MNVVIIEDEPFAQNELKRLLENTGKNVKVISVLESIEEAVDWFSVNQQPDIAFFDIQLSDGLSFDIFTQVKITAPVIFTTAYDQYAIDAFKVNSIDYLLKPIEQSALNKALEKLEDWKNQFDKTPDYFSGNQLENLLALANESKTYKNRFMVKVGEQIRFTKIEDIAYFYAEDNEVFLKNTEGRSNIIDYSLDQLNTMLNPNNFYRINRKYIANKNSIHKIHKYFNSRLKIELKPPREEEVLISRVKVAEFLNWMEH